MATITLKNLWNFIQSMSLSANNELWLAEKLHESAIKKQQVAQNKKYNAAEETPTIASEPIFGPKSIEEAISRVENAENDYAQNGKGTSFEDFTSELKAEQLW